ncbi:DALR anticodon-binding domain-containing protein 3-like [Alligator mississippiensis]|uniref:DALR anticodon-binding domain-containing protein 3-like n=1 Tax=Alligator mississippiensis TaxID=8496 RepID=A0A151NGE5_ALLMI|nr:DALR anticodon-binding domain-containing protein 3-like [Alligator mississippiensis]
METGEARLAVADTLAALNAALRRDAGPGLWFKETSARNLRSRDFLAPRGALRTLFPGGQLGVDWPWAPEAPSPPEAVAAWKRALSQCPHATAREPGPGADGTLFVVRLRSFLEQRGLQGYDPSLDVLRVTEEELRALAEVERAAQRSLAEAPGSACTVLHVVSGEEELQQQKADLLWRMLEPGALSAAQKHLVCGPVKATSASLPEGASQYYQ